MVYTVGDGAEVVSVTGEAHMVMVRHKENVYHGSLEFQ